MLVEVWSDVVCPWCFIGKRRLEKAISQLPDPSIINVRHRAFRLQPDIDGVVPTAQHLAEKYQVSAEQVREMQANVCSIADGEGLCYNLGETLSGNTLDAHRLLLWAQAEEGSKQRSDHLLEELYSSYFEKAEAIFSHTDLIRIATRIGFDADEVARVLASDAYASQVHEDEALSHHLGATGVPFFVFDMKYGISGAQPQEVFNQTLAAALEEAVS